MSIGDLQKLISKHLTEEVIIKFATDRSGLKDVKIKDIKIGAPPKKGESYGGIISRFSVNVLGKNDQGQEVSFFLPVLTKTLPPGLGRRKTMRSMDFFRSEATFYEKVWAPMRRFQDSKNVSEKFESIPTLLSSHIDGSNDYLAMEDLGHQNFVNAPRENGLDYEHTMLGVRMFAEFHGLALAFKDQQPEAFEQAASSLEEAFFLEKYRNWYGPFQQNLYTVFKDSVEKELPAMYVKKLKEMGDEDLFGKMCEQCQIRGPLAVITHGDIWLPNFLIKYDSKVKTLPRKMVMIDFPLSRYTTLSNDLALFLFVCTSVALLEKHWDDFVIEYHKHLGDTLEKYGSDRKLVSLKDIQEDIKKKVPFGIGMSMDTLTLSQVDDSDVSDLDVVEGDEAVPMESIWVVKPFKRQEQRKRISDLVKFIVDKGLI